MCVLCRGGINTHLSVPSSPCLIGIEGGNAQLCLLVCRSVCKHVHVFICAYCYVQIAMCYSICVITLACAEVSGRGMEMNGEVCRDEWGAGMSRGVEVSVQMA